MIFPPMAMILLGSHIVLIPTRQDIVAGILVFVFQFTTATKGCYEGCSVQHLKGPYERNNIKPKNPRYVQNLIKGIRSCYQVKKK